MGMQKVDHDHINTPLEAGGAKSFINILIHKSLGASKKIDEQLIERICQNLSAMRTHKIVRNIMSLAHSSVAFQDSLNTDFFMTLPLSPNIP